MSVGDVGAWENMLCVLEEKMFYIHGQIWEVFRYTLSNLKIRRDVTSGRFGIALQVTVKCAFSHGPINTTHTFYCKSP